ncbi:Retrovirus-related Pol polyprotein from transposon 17.6, partial [Stylophora pistillata]
MLERGIVQESVSAWSSPVVLVKKKDGSMRFCVDYRKLNKVTKKDSFPLPLISDTLDSLSGTNVFSTVDTKSGYWQIELHPSAREKTAFATHNGLYEFLVMPFGLTNSGQSFQRLMGHILRGLEYRFALIYIDDIIIFSKSVDEHLVHLEEIFKRLREANIKLNPKKCDFVKQRVEYLGHIVTPEGISPNPEKIRVVQEFPTPTNLKELRNFLGIGFTLAQVQDGKEVAIAFDGRGLNRAECNYSTTEREALALIEGIKKFQPYLQSRQFTVVTDHSSLRWLMNVKDASGRLARWALLLQQYDFEIVHRPGKMHGNADSLSRRPYDTRECNSIQKDEPKERELQRRDFDLSVIIDYLENDILPLDDSAARNLLLVTDSFYIGHDGLLYHLGNNRKRNAWDSFPQLVLPPALRFEILTSMHDHVSGDHFGVHKTFNKVKQRCWWKGMYKDVEHW